MTTRTADSRVPRPTMTDVAKAAGVSQTTVSFVLNNRTDVNIPHETRKRIRQAAADLGYRENVMAQALRLGKSNLIGLVTDEIATTPYAGLIIRGMQDAAWRYSRILTLVNTDCHADMEIKAVETLLKHQVDGLLFATMFHHEIALPPILGDMPVALVNCYSADASAPAVVPDEKQGGYDATCYLLERGHRDIGFLTKDESIPATRGRLAGYRRALAEAGLPFRDDRVVAFTGDQEAGFRGAMTLMRQPDRPSALFCFNDRLAMGAYTALQTLGLRVPDDVSIIGFDNQEIIAAHLLPTLTTMQLPHYEMGRWGVDRLFSNTPAPAAHMLLTCPLVERNSVAPLKLSITA
ncbi:MAG: LacI family DNA-binding transcriptional regulator [Herbaspirillum sp.]